MVGATGHVSIKTTHAADLAKYLAKLDRLEEAEQFATIGRAAAEDDLSSQSFAGTAETIVLAARGNREGAEGPAPGPSSRWSRTPGGPRPRAMRGWSWLASSEQRVALGGGAGLPRGARPL